MTFLDASFCALLIYLILPETKLQQAQKNLLTTRQSLYVCVYEYVYIYMYICMYASVYVSVSAYINVYVYVCLVFRYRPVAENLGLGPLGW